MKSITSLQEAAQAINELQNRLDTVNSKNWDRRQTRIVNAHPSIDPYDYVVRKELDERAQTTVVQGTGTGYEKVVFGVGINSNLQVDTDVCPHYISLYTLTADICLAKVKTVCSGSDIQVQFYKNGIDELFTTPLIIPIGSLAVQMKSDFAITSISYKDYLTCNVLQVGSGIRGKDLTVYLRFKIIGVPNG